MRLSGDAAELKGWLAAPLLLVVLLACSRPEAEQHALSPGPAPSPVSTHEGSPPTSEPDIATAEANTPSMPSIRDGGSRSVRGSKGMVVSVEDNATRAGVEILKAGGNAVDAAVAVAYALAVTHPSAGNIGGGGFMLVKLHGAPTVAVDFRERAPLDLTQQKFDAMIRARARGPEAVGVPGSVAGLNLAMERYGRLPLARVLEPAIRLARQGHRIGKQQALALGWSWRDLKLDPESRKIFGTKGGPKRQGELLVQADLANTLERIAERGSSGFYAGPVAAHLEAAFRRHGLIRSRDLEAYHAVIREPLRFDYRDLQVEVMPPSSAGGVAVAQMLLALERLDAQRLPQGSSAALHLFIEVARRAHAERRFGVIDPDSPGYDADARAKRWLNPTTLLDGVIAIDPLKATPSRLVSPYYKAAMRELEHTTHFSVVDAEGNVVSCTTTLSASFGAKFVAPNTGVVLNNSLAAFGTVGEAVPVAGQRMTSSMAPTLLLAQGRPIAVLGSPGGDTIPNTIVQVLRNLVDYQMTLDDAVDAPRVHQGFVPDSVRWESEHPIAPIVLAELKARGHRFEKRRVMGDANSIVIRYRKSEVTAWGYADPREGGLAQGVE